MRVPGCPPLDRYMGCIMSTAIGCMLCNHSCSVSKLAASLSFFPPSPASYTVTKTADGTCQLQFTNQEVQRALQQMPPSKVQAHVHQLMTKRKETIVLFHFTWPGAQTTLLWSHGNAMDVGEMYFFFLQLAEKLKVNIAVYDYAGYGGSSGEPSEANLYADILAVHDFLEGAGVEPERHLVLYGQSVGSAPSMWLATRRKVLAVILHTPLLSGLRGTPIRLEPQPRPLAPDLPLARSGPVSGQSSSNRRAAARSPAAARPRASTGCATPSPTCTASSAPAAPSYSCTARTTRPSTARTRSSCTGARPRAAGASRTSSRAPATTMSSSSIPRPTSAPQRVASAAWPLRGQRPIS